MLDNVWYVKNAVMASFAKLNLVFVAFGVMIVGEIPRRGNIWAGFIFVDL